MGHYCRICGRTRANEKFSGKGHKNHVCKDCSGKSGRKEKMGSMNETISDLEAFISENTYHDDSWLCEADFEKENAEDEKDEELPF